MIVVVIGMHKSGTTLVARLLHEAGISMLSPEDDREGAYDAGGFCERASTHQLNLALLGSEPDDVLGVEVPGRVEPGPELTARMHAAVDGIDEPDWGFKDPRTALVYDAWAQVLPEHCVIGVYRPVADLWPRFRYDGLSRALDNPRLARQLVRQWCAHNEAVLAAVERGSAPALLLSYDELMADDAELARLEAFVGRDVPDLRLPHLHRVRDHRSALVGVAAWVDALGGGRTVDAIWGDLEAARERQVAQT